MYYNVISVSFIQHFSDEYNKYTITDYESIRKYKIYTIIIAAVKRSIQIISDHRFTT
jgi:hypothetical protein